MHLVVNFDRRRKWMYRARPKKKSQAKVKKGGK